jgi:hypothetical protein
MQGSRAQFTIRSLMIAVAGVAVVLAMWRVWLVLLVVLSVIAGPLWVVVFVLARVPWREISWRSVIVNVMAGSFILAAGWLWARAALSSFRRSEGVGSLRTSSRAAQHEYWGLSVPMSATGIGLAVFLSRIIVARALQRRAELVLVAIGYAWAMAFAWISLYVWLRIETFG